MWLLSFLDICITNQVIIMRCLYFHILIYLVGWDHSERSAAIRGWGTEQEGPSCIRGGGRNEKAGIYPDHWKKIAAHRMIHLFVCC